MKLVLFDLDGTLVKAGGSGRLALDRALELLYGKKNVCANVPLAGGTDKDNFRRAFAEATGKPPVGLEIRRITELYLKCLPGEVKRAVRGNRYIKIRGVEKFLKALKADKNVMLGLGTGNIKEGAFIKLGPSGLEKYFAFGGFGCDALRRADVLRKAVARAEKLAGVKIPPSNVYVVGDTNKDVLAAKEAGYHSAAVTCGFGDKEEIRRSAPELVAESFGDLGAWLIWLGIKKDPKGVERGCYICPDTPIEHVHFSHTGMDTAQLKLLRKKKKAARM